MEHREKLEGMYKCTCIDAYKNRDMVDPTCLGCEFKSAIPEILSIINEPLTVEVECDKCSGKGIIYYIHGCSGCQRECEDGINTCPPCPHCDNGKVKRVIVWSYDDTCEFFPDSPCEGEPGHCMEIPCTCITRKPLTLPDLKDADVAYAYGMLDFVKDGVEQSDTWEIPNNKGTLRLEDK
jgi:hypothetical protein